MSFWYPLLPILTDLLLSQVQQAMFARLLLAAQNGELQGVEAVGGQGLGEGGGTLLVNDDCRVSTILKKGVRTLFLTCSFRRCKK